LSRNWRDEEIVGFGRIEYLNGVFEEKVIFWNPGRENLHGVHGSSKDRVK